MHLSSPKNPFLQDVRRALSSGRPTEDGRIVIEGPHLVSEVARSAWRLEQLIVTPHGRERHEELLGSVRADLIEVPARAFESISETQTSQEIMALVTPCAYTWKDCARADKPIVIVDGIQDPGNAGTIVRSAEAFDAGAVILTEGSVRIANGKFLRATAGSIFRLPHLENESRASIAAKLGGLKLAAFALTAQAKISLLNVDLSNLSALIVGSEAHGISAELLACSTGLRIPTLQVESLNAGVACSLALFEAARQRGVI